MLKTNLNLWPVVAAVRISEEPSQSITVLCQANVQSKLDGIQINREDDIQHNCSNMRKAGYEKAWPQVVQ